MDQNFGWNREFVCFELGVPLILVRWTLVSSFYMTAKFKTGLWIRKTSDTAISKIKTFFKKLRIHSRKSLKKGNDNPRKINELEYINNIFMA